MSESTTWNPDTYAKNARFVADLGEPVLRLLEPFLNEISEQSRPALQDSDGNWILDYVRLRFAAVKS